MGPVSPSSLIVAACLVANVSDPEPAPPRAEPPQESDTTPRALDVADTRPDEARRRCILRRTVDEI